MLICTVICRIIAALSQEERGLFKERIRFLDKKIYLGLTKLTWVSKGMAEYFINECRIYAGKVSVVAMTASMICLQDFLTTRR